MEVKRQLLTNEIAEKLNLTTAGSYGKGEPPEIIPIFNLKLFYILHKRVLCNDFVELWKVLQQLT